MPATIMIEQSRTLVSEMRSRLAGTRHRIASGRRLLNPWWELSGGSDVDGHLARSVRDRLERGILFAVPNDIWSARGRGTGRMCVICASAISREDVESEIVVRSSGIVVKLWAHLPCFTVWRSESAIFVALSMDSSSESIGPISA